jgi:lipopolysaccharide export system protein LptA
VRTSRVTFDRESGEARTGQPVEFKFAHGSGHGTGLHYSTRGSVARLEKDVEIALVAARKDVAPTRLVGAALEYARDARTMRLLGPVSGVQGSRELRTGALALEFSQAMLAQRLLAGGRPELRERSSTGETALAADDLEVALSPEGFATRVIAAGQAVCTAKDAFSADRLAARRLEMSLTAHGRQPQHVRATGAVRAESQRVSGPLRRLESELLLLDFAAAGRAVERRLNHVESPLPALLEWRAADEQSSIRAGRMTAELSGRSEVQRVTADAGVDVERRLGRRPAQTTSSRQLVLQFDSRGDWSEVEQTGDVRFREGARNGQAQRARIVRARETIFMDGPATLADAVSSTTAQALEINQRSGEVLARGNVRTSYLSAASSAAATSFVPAFASQPAHITAEELRANSEEGRALYSGKARLWQGETVIQAGSIELRRTGAADRQLLARGAVQSIFPQARAVSPSAAPAAALWRARSSQLLFHSSNSLVRLDEAVHAESAMGQIDSRRLDLFLSAEGSGPRQLTRAEATGDVTVRQGPRRGTAERAEYFAREGKFILSGGKPTLYDAVLGATTGRQLTFFLADDRILVESEEGSRTVTKHRVAN